MHNPPPLRSTFAIRGCIHSLPLPTDPLTVLDRLGGDASLAICAHETTSATRDGYELGPATHHARLVLSQVCSRLNRNDTGLAVTAVGSCDKLPEHLLGLLLSSNRVRFGLLHHRLDYTLLLRRQVGIQVRVELWLFLLQP
jgi:hypothetical protein